MSKINLLLLSTFGISARGTFFIYSSDSSPTANLILLFSWDAAL